ncbi:ATP-dependent zinc protease [Candidatus Saccharibacteria bacterium]|nr:ATP-dependent zinc protease [Candidatus Saccharibacteria bacterium]MBR0060605.1 ATP-dependent zinc protease [Selenomonadaceae bacterium]
MNEKNLEIIGSTEYVEVAGIKNIPAKIDTGADSSSIWASHIDVDKDGTLSFQLFNESSSFYTGETLTRQKGEYKVKIVRSGHGDERIRYRTEIDLTVNGHKIHAMFTLADRSRNNFPVLIGRRTLTNKFLVDVSKMTVKKQSNPKTPKLNQELRENPYEFHQKYGKTM